MGQEHVELSPLGKNVVYCSEYNPALLFPIARKIKRDELAMPAILPFRGVDIWTAYELSWLNLKGKPMVAVGEFEFPADSPNIIESKSFKLYLNSFNGSRFASQAEVIERLTQDLSAASGGNVKIKMKLVGEVQTLVGEIEDAFCLDHQDIEIHDYQLTTSYLSVSEKEVEQTLYSNLLKSNCLVTGQPDWGTVVISYRGKQIEQTGLLRYIISYRNHMEFHEQCVERIFMDIQRHCQPEALTVYARYVRRGGLDINPHRSNFQPHVQMPRLVRQ
ncbi:NADPH-dependent 7-cyano-7-deazaguanine reductase QueF [Thiomicrospira sp. R3]|uniref:NADPH-dependent 7-cyano-7-deazaguanine reductase QueF n=1 Tax=Thiomicrospira sp. R3 TaxID=3035472 RepID=UPI00259B0EB2|nr:NADPH-dependent 7-cyano-7-deazaguanine reductase QueF [Thiomicrospira sp. R3]WFE69437.1 NADPH-dependent 7-cyano-7-deazaguanine reductase QueF [Thiomicrospira sp. R3]